METTQIEPLSQRANVPKVQPMVAISMGEFQYIAVEHKNDETAKP